MLTSPPYWTLKRYHDHPGQMGHITDYKAFLDQLDQVWQASMCFAMPDHTLPVRF
ncbi:MAG TPA: hypothetical protein PKM43_22900 [Verrucomicrobiota bacterium]|nr:hypothetical protein [Verrucomicrobiota bacterium]